MIDLDPNALATIKTLIERHLPDSEVRVFGSRVNGTAKPFSDLDLALVDKAAIPIETLQALQFDLSNSDLPIMVDVVDWHTLSEAFQAVIHQHYEVLPK